MRSSAACDQERSDKRPDELPSELLIEPRAHENWGSLQFGVFQQNRSIPADQGGNPEWQRAFLLPARIPQPALLRAAATDSGAGG
jgi:hypothetical protein